MRFEFRFVLQGASYASVISIDGGKEDLRDLEKDVDMVVERRDGYGT